MEKHVLQGGLYQCSNGREVLGHLTEQGPSADIPKFQGLVSEHHHQVLPTDANINTNIIYTNQISDISITL